MPGRKTRDIPEILAFAEREIPQCQIEIRVAHLVFDPSLPTMVDREHPLSSVPWHNAAGCMNVVVENIDTRKDRISCRHRFPVLSMDPRHRSGRTLRTRITLLFTQTSHLSDSFPRNEVSVH